MITRLCTLVALLVTGTCLPAALAVDRITVVVGESLEPPAEHGLAKLESALRAKGLEVEHSGDVAAARGDALVIAGLSSDSGPAIALLRALNVDVPEEQQALAVHRSELSGKPAVVLCGSDAVGLMYALLDTADRISWSENPQDPFQFVRNVAEKPDMLDRSLSIVSVHRGLFESRLHDEQHWKRYFDMMAKNRFNHFLLIFGYKNARYRVPVFTGPLYPYLFDLEEFPEVRYIGMTAAAQRRNIAALKRVIQLAHERGIRFGAGVWDQIDRRVFEKWGEPNGDAVPADVPENTVWGVTPANLIPYTKAAFGKFLRTFPEIDSVQFRMHWEAGIEREEAVNFWHEMWQMIRKERPQLAVDARAKGVPQEVFIDAAKAGLNFRVATKYWMEHMGMPFHPTHVNEQNQHDRRHSYADLLRYPRIYQMHWRLWNGGTTRFLLWGDPDYVRRFVSSAHLYGGKSFEVNEPLYFKMNGTPHNQEPFELLNARYRYYDEEFERYWHFFQTFGRLGYNPGTPSEVWEKEFERRFGENAGSHVMEGLHAASRVLPRIIAASYLYRMFPSPMNSAERERIGDLPEYAEKHTGTDTAQFASVAEEAEAILTGSVMVKRSPTDTSRWFAQTARQILECAANAESSVGAAPGEEFLSTVTDLKILAHLAEYHSHRLRAGLMYRLYQQTGDRFSLEEAVQRERNAVLAWERIVEAAGDVYFDALDFTIGISPHWKDELVKLRSGLEKLEKERAAEPSPPNSKPLAIAHVPVRRLQPGHSLEVRTTVHSKAVLERVTVKVAADNAGFKPVAMEGIGTGMYRASIPDTAGRSELRYVISAVDASGRTVIYPKKGEAEPIVVTVTGDDHPPAVRLQRAGQATAGRPFKVTALVDDPAGVDWVRLRYRHVTQYEDYRTAEMALNRRTGLYEATIPGAFVSPEWDLMYFIEAADIKGNGRAYPDFEKESPYVIVELTR